MTLIKETTKTQTAVKELETNLNEVIDIINTTVQEKNWMIVVDSNEVSQLNFKSKSIVDSIFGSSKKILVDFSRINLSQNQKKKIAKKIWRVKQKPSRRNINTLFFLLRKNEIITETINVKLSKKEQTIQAKRKVWIKLRNEADLALKDYKTEKGNFYK